MIHTSHYTNDYHQNVYFFPTLVTQKTKKNKGKKINENEKIMKRKE